MKAEISLHNLYSPWTEVHADGVRCWLKGTLFHGNELLRSNDVVRLFSPVLQESQRNYNSLKALLIALNGNFALVMETPGHIFCTVDRLRSIPLFYAMKEDEAIFSDNANYLRNRLDPPFNEENGAEFLVTGYVTGPDTLFDGISQLQAGEFLVYDKADGSLTTRLYHRFWHENFFSDPEEELLNRLDKAFVHVFQRLIKSTKGLQIVVPLSGGLDSRIIVAMLKRLGVDDVICFTYGKKGNREAEISRQVAEALGYRWYFVEYTNKKWYACAHTDAMRAYYSYAGNLVSLPHIQDFLAVKELKERGDIPENAVFVPGHTGDMISGGHIPKDYDQPQSYTFEKFLEDSLKKHYNLWRWDPNELGQIFKEKITKSVGDISVHDNESCADAIELFDFNERQAKFIVNSVRVYEYFGYQWRVPLWDAELITLFLGISFVNRLGQTLYLKYAKMLFFGEHLRPLMTITSTTPLNSESKKSSINTIYRTCKCGFNICGDIVNHIDWGWSSNFKKPLIAKIFSQVLGYPNENLRKYPQIYRIPQVTRQKRSVPSCNGTQTIVYLQDIILE